MSGTIRKRAKDSWELRFDVGRDPTTGRRKFRYQTVRGSRKQAEQALTQALHRRDTGMDVVPSRITVAEYLDRWLRDYAEVNVAPSTLQRYRQVAGRLQTHLGHLRLQALRPAHIQETYARLLKDGLAPRTVLHHHRMLRQALKHAVQWRLLTHNPADAVTAPRAERAEMRALDADGVHKLLDACRDEQMRTIVSLAVMTGMREGELLGLRWSDCDLDGATIHVVRTAQYLSSTGVMFRTPKTAGSKRSIALSAETVSLLREHRTKQLEARLALGPSYRNADLVFATAEGDVIPPYRISNAFQTVVKHAGIGPLRFHDLRHTAASLLLKAGVHPKIVSERLGHATVAITLDVYSHVTPDLQRQAAAAVDVILARP
jgi:integrase